MSPGDKPAVVLAGLVVNIHLSMSGLNLQTQIKLTQIHLFGLYMEIEVVLVRAAAILVVVVVVLVVPALTDRATDRVRLVGRARLYQYFQAQVWVYLLYLAINGQQEDLVLDIHQV
jgi:hypothetical protein